MPGEQASILDGVFSPTSQQMVIENCPGRSCEMKRPENTVQASGAPDTGSEQAQNVGKWRKELLLQPVCGVCDVVCMCVVCTCVCMVCVECTWCGVYTCVMCMCAWCVYACATSAVYMCVVCTCVCGVDVYICVWGVCAGGGHPCTAPNRVALGQARSVQKSRYRRLGVRTQCYQE